MSKLHPDRVPQKDSVTLGFRMTRKDYLKLVSLAAEMQESKGAILRHLLRDVDPQELLQLKRPGRPVSRGVSRKERHAPLTLMHTRSDASNIL
jgi:hypothetical protein